MLTLNISTQTIVLLILGHSLFIIIYIAWQLNKRNKNNPFPDRHDVEIIHQERRASGCSHKTWLTKYGGASNALIVKVTPTELWITTPWFFGWLAPRYDLDHRIPLNSITNIKQSGKKTTIYWSSDNQHDKAFDLQLRQPDTFLKAIGHNPAS